MWNFSVVPSPKSVEEIRQPIGTQIKVKPVPLSLESLNSGVIYFLLFAVFGTVKKVFLSSISRVFWLAFDLYRTVGVNRDILYYIG